jgi:hypothetical protein
LSNNNCLLKLVRDGTYSSIVGVVKDNKSNLRIPDATITAAGLTTTTNEHGLFELTIPEEKQLTEQRVNVLKLGYEEWSTIEPVFKNIDIIVRLNKIPK